MATIAILVFVISAESDVACANGRCMAKCKTGGCSDELCVDYNANTSASICMFECEYRCNEYRVCQKNESAQCEWTTTNKDDELKYQQCVKLCEAVKINHDSYKDAYTAFRKGLKDYDIITMMKYGLLRDTDTNRRLLAIGPGPNPYTAFLEQMMNEFDEIILVEINPHFVKSYKEQTWYMQNQYKIKIYQNRIEDIELDNDDDDKFSDFKPNSFDIIFVNHVAYHFLLDDIKNIILPKFDKLLKEYGHSMISVAADSNPLISLVFKKLKPKYKLGEFIEECLKNDNYSHFQVLSYNDNYLTPSQTRSVCKLFVIEDLYHHPDYHKGDISNDDMRAIDELLNKEFSNIVLLDADSDKVNFRELSQWFIMRKRRY